MSADIESMRRATVLSERGILSSVFAAFSPSIQFTISLATGKHRFSPIVWGIPLLAMRYSPDMKLSVHFWEPLSLNGSESFFSSSVVPPISLGKNLQACLVSGCVLFVSAGPYMRA